MSAARVPTIIRREHVAAEIVRAQPVLAAPTGRAEDQVLRIRVVRSDQRTETRARRHAAATTRATAVRSGERRPRSAGRRRLGDDFGADRHRAEYRVRGSMTMTERSISTLMTIT